MIEPLPDELRALIAHERHVPRADRAAIRTKLAASVGAAPVATIASAKLATLALASLAVVAGVWWLSRGTPHGEPPPAPAIEEVVYPATPEPSATEHELAPPPAAPAPTAPAHVPSETELLAKAWQALARRDGAQALALVAEHQKFHAHGVLAEEREALRIEALVSVGRGGEARALAQRFFAQYPASVHRKRVEAVLP